ncbi:Cupin-like domain-containing protein [Elsinoe fawcettii]|nr:Cupin-like domain-containing protein [Elsinoe fawcettii]
MFENDSIQAFHHKQPKKPLKMQAMGVPAVGKRDEFIMDTNSSSIVSKRSVEKLYYPKQAEYFRFFVRKFQRRSPLINRGYWLRMKAIEKTVAEFLEEDSTKTKVVVNLGCGYDPLPFQFLGLHPEQCHNCVFVDVDYPQLMQKKVEVIKNNQPLLDVLPDISYGKPTDPLLASTERYKAVGCDLKDVANLDSALRSLFDIDACSIAFLFVAEVSVAYMEKAAANAVLAWTARLPEARFCLLEQHLPDGPDHPFAETMLKHFQKLRTPLHAIGTLEEMQHRFETAGWPTKGLNIKTLWELWSDDHFLTTDERRHLDTVEPFDEWEEFALFGAHYFLLRATNQNNDECPVSVDGQCSSGMNDVEAPAISAFKSASIYGTPHSRRFGAAAPVYRLASQVECAKDFAVAQWGGLGSRERLKNADMYLEDPKGDEHAVGNESTGTEHNQPSKYVPDLPSSMMCHTVTTLDRYQALLVGGRAAPDKASSSCWLLSDGQWQPTHSLPQARFRHGAVHITTPSTTGLNHGVLVFGGKTSQGEVLNDWLLFQPENGWIQLQASGSQPEPRFGAIVIVNSDACSGHLLGGMRDDGTIIQDHWSWTLSTDTTVPTVVCERFEGFDKPALSRLCRFGAVTAKCSGDVLVIGGVSDGGMLTRRDEVMSLNSGAGINIEWDKRPLLVGMSALSINEQMLLLGGGATCFSFGTYWSDSQILGTRESDMSQWKVHDHSLVLHGQSSISRNTNQKQAVANPLRIAEQISRRTVKGHDDFKQVLRQSQPIVFENLDLGPCTKLWTTEYLKQKVGDDRDVVIHDSPSPKMSFQSKNFSYKTTTFGSFLDRVEDASHVYLRALSSDRPAEAPTDLSIDFPSLAPDFVLPDSLNHVTEYAHSSPLRISGPVNMWLHYDVMANVLCQIRGSKRLLLYHPSDVVHLGILPGASSSSIDPFDPTPEEAAILARVTPYETVLNEGDILLIPPLWLHTAKPLTNLSVAVNVFFRDERMDQAYAAGKDVYGNRDIAAYERGRRDVQRMVKQFDGLPDQVREFYLRRLADELRSSI